MVVTAANAAGTPAAVDKCLLFVLPNNLSFPKICNKRHLISTRLNVNYITTQLMTLYLRGIDIIY